MERSEEEIKYREKYEAMLRGTMKEIEGNVRKAQWRAEENSKSHTEIIINNNIIFIIIYFTLVSLQRANLLTEQLLASEERVKKLEKTLEENRTRQNEAEGAVNALVQKKLQCLECMCCLTMSVRMDHNQQPVYTCTVDDGVLNGELDSCNM